MSKQAQPATFDSATAIMLATAFALRGEEFPPLGQDYGRWLRPALALLNALPRSVREGIYRVGSGREGLPLDVIARADAERLGERVVSEYDRSRRYPGAVIGSTPGSTAHLAVALGMPLLPQTLLLPVRRRGVHLDDPRADIAAVRPAAEAMLAANPELILHHMFDPNSDRLTLKWFTYFRVKRTRLGRAYERFLSDTLESGATIYVTDCRHRWPTTLVGERHIFQFGGVGGVSPTEYIEGSDRISEFLRREKSPRSRWDPPSPDGERPEAEWGFDPELWDDIVRFADEHDFRVQRIEFDEADALSPLVAELHRWWYERIGWPTDRMFIEAFVLLDPYWTLRTASVPYWMTFNGAPGKRHVASYLESTSPYDYIDVTLISNGIRALGEASPEDFRDVLEQARVRGSFSGVDTHRYPSDLAVFVRYRDALTESNRRYPLPKPLTVEEFDEFLRENKERFSVEIS